MSVCVDDKSDFINMYQAEILFYNFLLHRREIVYFRDYRN